MSAARGLVVSVVTGLVMSLVPAVPVLAAVAVPGTAGGPMSGDVSVPVSPRGGVAPSVPVPAPDRVSVVWPVAGSAVVSLAGPSGYLAGEDAAVSGSGSPGGLPVTVRAPALSGLSGVDGAGVDGAGLDGAGVGAAPSAVLLSVWDRARAEAAGVRGVVLEVSRADGVDAAAQVALDVSYAAFGHGFGGDFGSRLRLATLPGCVLTTPQLAACQVVTPVTSSNNPVSDTVSAPVVQIPGSSGAGAAGAGVSGSAADDGGSGSVVLAVTSGTSSAEGDFGATSWAPSFSWAAGGQSGDFSTSVPVRVPPAPGGLVPQVSLGYSSGSVDGRVASTNNQPSWLGEGWDLQFGYVEGHYRSCRDDGQLIDDWCSDDNIEYSLVLGGRSSRLVLDDTQGFFHTEQDEGLRVEQRRATSSLNGVDEGMHWVVYAQDGTVYWLGTDVASTLSVPVFGDDAGERCHRSEGLSWSYCDRGWRWNIRKVVDRRGNVMEFFWQKEPHRYGRYGNAGAHLYDRAAVVQRIDYGANTVAGTGHTGRVEFGLGWRCLAEPCMGGTENNAKWHDTPWDLYCSVEATSCPHLLRPAFFSLYRLREIRTLVWQSGAWALVDTWAMGHSWPATVDGSSMALWLYTVAHTGHVAEGGPDPNLPGDVTWFGPVGLANRVYIPGYTIPMTKHRIGQIATNGGGDTRVAYAPAECTPGALPAENTNTKRCFPVHWQNGPGGAEWNWFHKYVVASVTEKGLATGDVDETWTYTYGNSSNMTNSQVMWAWDDSPNLPNEDKSWTQWRGYLNVEVNHGPTTGANRSITRTVYHRGLHGDRTVKSGGAPRSVSMSDGDVAGIVDEAWLRGFARSQTTVDAATGARVAWVRHLPVAALSAYRLYDFGKATIVREGSTIANELRRDGTVRTRRVEHTYDLTSAGEDARYGLLLSTRDDGDSAVAGDEVCTSVEYARNLGAWMLDFPSQTHTTTCADNLLPPNQLGLTQVFYDGAGSHTTEPSRGLVTTTREALSIKLPTAVVWVSTATMTHDTYGRVRESRDALGRLTTTAYTPAAGGPTTGTTVTNPAGHVVTTDLAPGWGAPKTVTDPNGKTTSIGYDGLGRVSTVDLPGATGADLQYTYELRGAGGNVVTTRALGPTGTMLTSYAIFDGRLRPRQAQTLAPDGNRGISDTLYDDRGLVAKASAFYNASPPAATLVSAADIDVANQHQYLYDSLRRQTADILRSHAVEKWRTSTSHWADQAHVNQPIGGTDTTTFTDVFGRTSRLRQHTSTGDVDTGYGYTRLGQLAAVTDTAGNRWTYDYDLLGRTVQTVDPDRGMTSMTYDHAGQLLTTTDARPVTLAYRYDTLGRKTGLFRDSVASGTKLAEWVYDTLAKGQLTSATRHAGGNPYTTAVTGYDDGYRPTGTSVTIPAAEVGLAGTYTFAASYKVDGSPATQTLPAAGGLPAETLTYGYTTTGRLDTLTGAAAYVTDTGWHFDDLLNWTWHGNLGKRVLQQWNRDGIRRLSAIDVRTEIITKPGAYDERAFTSYDYDQAGNVTAAVGRTDAVVDQVECFGYDDLRRLVRAFTTSAGGSCGTPQRAGADPYHLEWEYDTTGNRTKQTDHGPSGPTVTTYTYPAPGTAQPHTLRQAVRSGGATGTDTYTYDPAGNTLSRPGQTLTWDPEGHLATLVAGGQTSTYIYDADGNRLIARDTTGKTLYLPGGTQLRHTTATGTVTATRYYTHAGVIVAVRTVSGGLSWLAADHHGTNTLAITSSLSVQRRRSLPFGGPRGTPPTNWPGDKGFVGGTQDPTGLTHLGAREYDPQTGRFITVDPLQDMTDPQQWNGYAYSNNSPVTFSDPSGLEHDSESGPCTVMGVGCRPYTDTDDQSGRHTPLVPGKVKANPDAKVPAKREAPARIPCGAYEQSRIDCTLGVAVEVPEYCGGVIGHDQVLGCIKDGGPFEGDPVQGLFMLVAFFVLLAIAPALPVLSAEVGLAAVDAGSGGAITAAGTGTVVTGGGAVAVTGGRAGLHLLRGACSFSGDTHVLLADGTTEPGTTKPLAEVKVGDVVLATDPDTGEKGPRRVTGVWVHEDLMVDLVLDGDRKITTTEDHPFWNATDKEWQQAQQLSVGDELYTPGGVHIGVRLVDWSSAHNGLAYNLTVDDIHTYYVLAGNAPVLVHNCGEGWTIRARMRAAGPGDEFGLPSQGRIRYVPPVGYNPVNPLPRGSNGGYVDRFGNEWVVGPSRTQGHPFEWDVQLSRTGQEQLGWLSRDGHHINVDPFGEVTHR